MFHYLLDTWFFGSFVDLIRNQAFLLFTSLGEGRDGGNVCYMSNVIDLCRHGLFAILWLVLLLPWKRRFLGHQFIRFCTAQRSYMLVYYRPFRCVCPGFVSECESLSSVHTRLVTDAIDSACVLTYSRDVVVWKVWFSLSPCFTALLGCGELCLNMQLLCRSSIGEGWLLFKSCCNLR